MNEEAAFMKAILAEPDDDAPRLIFADWLEERGDPRAGFIRVQCELARLDAADPRRSSLLAQERGMLDRHGTEWLGPLRPHVRTAVYHRGFLDGLLVPAADYVREPLTIWPATLRCIAVVLDGFEVPQAVLEFIPELVARENQCLPIGFRRHHLILAMANARDLELLAKIAFILNRDVEPVAADQQQLVDAINRHCGAANWPVDTPRFVYPEIEFDRDEVFAGTPAAKLIELMIGEAIRLKATEIRIEPSSEEFHVFYRIKGRLIARDAPPIRILRLLVAYLKSVAGLDVESTGEQSGRLRFRILSREYDVGVIIRPGEFGPSIVFTL